MARAYSFAPGAKFPDFRQALRRGQTSEVHLEWHWGHRPKPTVENLDFSGTIEMRGLLRENEAGRLSTPLAKDRKSKENAGTHFTGLDGCCIRPQTETQGPQALPIRTHAGAAIPLQSSLRGVRQDPISGAHFEDGIEPGRVLEGRGGMRHADGFDSRRRAADALADR